MSDKTEILGVQQIAGLLISVNDKSTDDYTLCQLDIDGQNFSAWGRYGKHLLTAYPDDLKSPIPVRVTVLVKQSGKYVNLEVLHLSPL